MSNIKKEQDEQGVDEAVNIIRKKGGPHDQTLLTALLMKLANLETRVSSSGNAGGKSNSARTTFKK